MTDHAAEFLHSSWKVFIDGVEVPHQGVSFSFSPDTPSTASIVMEPDKELYKLRPQSMVHVFARDRFVAPLQNLETDLQDNYYLYWEGVSIAVGHRKGPTSRSMELTAAGILSILDNTKAFSIGIGAGVHSSLLEGSELNPILANTTDTGGSGGVDLFSARFLTNAFAEETGTDPALAATFVDRVIRCLTFLGSHNSLLRQQMVRSRLLDKLSSVPDNTLGGLLSLGMLKAISANLSNSLHQESSVLEIVRYMLSFGFYTIYTSPFPATPDSSDDASSAYPVPAETEAAVASRNADFPRGSQRNDVMLLPDTSYALPPACNMIFPEMISGLNFSRSYMQEPTRFVLEDPYLLQTLGSSIISYLAPSSIIRADVDRKTLTSDKLMGVALDLIVNSTAVQLAPGQSGPPVPVATTTSAYSSGGVNLLKLTSDLEIEKGIVLEHGMQGMAVFTAAATGSGFSNDGFAEEQSVTDALVSITDQSTKQGKYAAYMASITQYLFQKSKQNRSLNVTLQGHRWLVPGFPCIVFDETISYLGQVRSVSFQVSDTGQEMSSIELSYARAVPSVSAETIKLLVGSLSTVGAAVDDSKASVEALFANKLEKLSRSTKSIADFRNFVSEAIRSTTLPRDSFSNLLGSGPELCPDAQRQTLLNSMLAEATRDAKALIAEARSLIKGTEGTGPFTLYPSADKTPFTQIRRYFGTTAISTSPPSQDIPGMTQTVYHAKYLLQEITNLELWVTGQKFLIDGEGALVPRDPSRRPGDAFVIGADRALLRFSASGTSLSVEQTAKSVITVLTDWSNFIFTAVAWIKAVYLDQQAQALAGTVPVIQDVTLQTAVTGLVQNIENEEKLLSEFLAKFEDSNDWAVPPDSFNSDFLDLGKLDALYGELLGCKPLYATTATPSASNTTGLAPELLTARGKAIGILSFLKGLIVLDSIYPIFETSTTTSSDSIRSHPAQLARSGPRTGLFEWAETTFLKRRATTLRQFADQNQLRTESVSVTGGVFHIFTPMNPGVKLGGLLWDDTIFSKIVDDSQLFRPAKPADPMIGELRKAVILPELTTSVRQAQIRSYSQRHFSTRGFGRN